MKKPKPFFIEDETLCVKEQGEYLEVRHVNCVAPDGSILVLVPSFVDGHLLLSEKRGGKKIQTIQKVPKSKRFAGLRIPAEYITYDLDKVPYTLEKTKRPRR